MVVMVADQVREKLGGSEREEAKLRKQLVELRLRYEMDEIDEQEYRRATADVKERLRFLREGAVGP
jgi:uncharacterized membrane protein